VIAIDSPYISEVIDDLAARKIPVVALLSDLSATNLAGYVGIINRIAGRTAAWAIARCARQPGSVGVLVGSHGYLGQEDRGIGFRSYFREKGPEFKVLEPLICGDDTGIAYKETLEMLEGSKDLVGLYSVGGGNRGTIRALEESGFSTKPAYVCHELTPPVRSGLIRGTVDFVLAHLPAYSEDGAVHAVVEAPKGSLVKLKYEIKLGAFTVSHSAVSKGLEFGRINDVGKKQSQQPSGRSPTLASTR
jgi:LacI family transcriptional regulator